MHCSFVVEHTIFGIFLRLKTHFVKYTFGKCRTESESAKFDSHPHARWRNGCRPTGTYGVKICPSDGKKLGKYSENRAVSKSHLGRSKQPLSLMMFAPKMSGPHVFSDRIYLRYTTHIKRKVCTVWQGDPFSATPWKVGKRVGDI